MLYIELDDPKSVYNYEEWRKCYAQVLEQYKFYQAMMDLALIIMYRERNDNNVLINISEAYEYTINDVICILDE